MADESSEENEEEEDELQMLREEVSSLETLVDESAEVIGVLRQKYNEEKSDNSILAQKLMTLEAENEFYRRENESLEKANKRLQNEVKAMEHEIKLEDDVQRTLSETTHIAELNKLIDANNDIMVGADSRSNFFDEYQDYVQRLVDIDGSTGPDLFEEILSSLRIVAQQTCDNLVEIDEEEEKLKESFPDVEFTKKKDDEEVHKKKKSKRKKRGEDFVFGSPSGRFPVLTEDPELDEREANEEASSDSSEEDESF